MKRLFGLFIITLVAMSCLSVSCDSFTPTKVESLKRQGWDDFPLIGDVESVTMTRYKVKNEFGDFVQGDIESCEKFYFNAAGDVVEEVRYNSSGSLVEKYIYKYDSNGNMIEEAKYGGDGSLERKMTYTYKYDPKGNMIETTTYDYVDYMVDFETKTNYIETFIPRSRTVLEISYRN